MLQDIYYMFVISYLFLHIFFTKTIQMHCIFLNSRHLYLSRKAPLQDH